MKNYDIEVGALITINESWVFTEEAESYEIAREKAIERFQQYIDKKYAWCDYDEIHTEKLDEYGEDMI